MSEAELFDVAVIGGGPAGLSAVTWLARYRHSVAFFDSGKYRNAYTEQSHGYLGKDPINPGELRDKAESDLLQYLTVKTFDQKVVSASGESDDFELRTEAQVFRARRIVLCTGVSDTFPDIENFFEHYGANAFHCASCDGYEAQGKNVVVIGWGAHVTGFAAGLKQWSTSVTVLTDAHELQATSTDRSTLDELGIAVIGDEALAFTGKRGALDGIKLKSGAFVECDYVFFSIAHTPHIDLAEQLGCAIEGDGYIDIDRDGRTSVDGVFAAGDVTPGYQVVQVAAGQGASAGLAAVQSLAPH